MKRVRVLPLRLLCLFLLGSSVALADDRNEAMFAKWQSANAAAVAAFQRHLQRQDLQETVPMHELLRSASSWRDCNASPFAIPPTTQWPAVVGTLQLLRELKQQEILKRIEVASAYRDQSLNACAGGASRSAHFTSFALDLLPVDDPGAAERVCQFWREQGRQWNMGASRYRSGRIHIDVKRYRTWGSGNRSCRL